MLRAGVAIALSCLLGSSAWAHTRLTYPVPRSPSDGLKTGPCGGVPPGTPNLIAVGSTITVVWNETIDHPGYFRIAWSPPGDQGFEQNVLLDNIPDQVCTAPPCEYRADVTLPDQKCQGCALQIIQFMGTAAPYSPYFSCADVDLVDASEIPDAGVPMPDAGASGGDVDAGPTDGSDAGIGGGAATGVGGCAAGGQGGGGALALLGLALVAIGRRRRR